MNRDLIRASITAGARLEFSRSGGPGGQNVNKVNSRVTARIALDEVAGLTEREREHARMRLGSRLTSAGEIMASADDERDQPRNRELALTRLAILVEGAAAIPKRRIRTRPTRSSVERRLDSKRIRSTSKKLRGAGGSPSDD